MKRLYPITISLASLCLIPAIAPPPAKATSPPATTIAPTTSPAVQLAQRRRRSLSWRVGVRSSRYRIGGFSRSGNCANQAKMTAFVPPPRPDEQIKPADGAVDTTLSDRPTFWVYLTGVPKTSQVQFTLQDSGTNPRELYNTRFAVNGETGILGVRLPPSVPALKVGESYLWQMAIACDPNDPSSDRITIGSWLQRISLSQVKATPGFAPQPIIQALASATEMDKPALYAELGIWQDAVTSIIALRQKQPNDQELQADWRSLLTATQMGGFINTPLLGVK